MTKQETQELVDSLRIFGSEPVAEAGEDAEQTAD